MLPTPIFLAMMWWYGDGTPTIAFWYAGTIALLMVAEGIWCLVAPESFRGFYLNLLRNTRRGLGGSSEMPGRGWWWSSAGRIRLGGAGAIAVAVVFITWVVFFTLPGRVY